jgi:signal peptidase I
MTTYLRRSARAQATAFVSAQPFPCASRLSPSLLLLARRPPQTPLNAARPATRRARARWLVLDATPPDTDDRQNVSGVSAELSADDAVPVRYSGAFQAPSGEGDGEDDNSGSRVPAKRSRAVPQLPWWRRVAQGFEADDLRTFAVSFAVALLFRSFVVEPRFIPSESMYPTFEIGDQLLVEKLSKLVRPFVAGDVVVFVPPPALIQRGYTAKDAFIKRVVAAEGDSIRVSNGHVELNGVVQAEPYIADTAEYEWGPASVPAGYVMVLGDNRNNSYDSHIWGFLPTSNIIGRSIARYWPPARLGSTILPRTDRTASDAASQRRPNVLPAPASSALLETSVSPE